MGSPSSKVRRKKKADKQQRLNTLATVNRSNDTEYTKFSSQTRPRVAVQDDFEIKNQPLKNFDLNSLPRQKVGSDEIIKAIDDVNKRLAKSNIKKPNSTNDEAMSPKVSEEIDNLVKEVKRKVKKHDDLDKKLDENNKKISDLYAKLSRTSLESLHLTKSEQNLKRNCSNVTRIVTKQVCKEDLLSEIEKLKELEKRKILKLLEQDRLLAAQKKKSDDNLLLSTSSSNLESFLEQNKKVKNFKNIKDLTRARYNNDLTRVIPIDGIYDHQYSKSNTLLKSIKNIFDEDLDHEPVYDKPNDLKLVDIRPDADLMKVVKKCNGIKDLYKIDADELAQIIKYVEEKERENSASPPECSYYLKGTEIYSTISKTKSKSAVSFKLPDSEINTNNFESKEKLDDQNTKIVKQILEDLVLNYNLEKQNDSMNSKGVHYTKHTNLKKNESSRIGQSIYSKFNVSSTSLPNDPMPNVTKFIEDLKNDKQHKC
ncbi:unnamed protein product [Brachionus calyciflorus]|uniref:Uncharacterized protein n=1 Tax=Brachionus calyciflorus TaxID=104777 RepID=A0A813UIS6_9BILA|nr:unnamed protein product [Brachionus calyciflorus]